MFGSFLKQSFQFSRNSLSHPCFSIVVRVQKADYCWIEAPLTFCQFHISHYNEKPPWKLHYWRLNAWHSSEDWGEISHSPVWARSINFSSFQSCWESETLPVSLTVSFFILFFIVFTHPTCSSVTASRCETSLKTSLVKKNLFSPISASVWSVWGAGHCLAN